jgi:hypothetical protein
MKSKAPDNIPKGELYSLIILSLTNYLTNYSDARNKYAELTGDYAPPSIPAFANINEGVNLTTSLSSCSPHGEQDSHYFFPDPGLFFGTSEKRTPVYFAQWQYLQSAFILRYRFGNAKPLHPKDWRQILSLPLAPKVPNNPHSTSSQITANVRQFLQSCLSEFDVEAGEECVPEDVIKLDTSTQKRREIVWELCERNWRYELLMLDRRVTGNWAVASYEDVNDPRLGLVLDCFAGQSLSAVSSDLADEGLASRSWLKRRPYWIALQKLMRGWAIPKPPALSFSVDQWEEGHAQIDAWEREIAMYYAQTFHDICILPRQLM